MAGNACVWWSAGEVVRALRMSRVRVLGVGGLWGSWWLVRELMACDGLSGVWG